ncbi:Ger(x)C family spore germination C-terminal domain-containing protein [Paenibacillus sp. P25]|nr:Ger(x)C family spore germination C-terminal domain-containing protein [Paenibacillus sp. P25]
MPGARVVYSGMAVFNKSDKMIGWLSEKESKGYHFTQKGKVQSTLIQFACPAGSGKAAGMRSKEFANVEMIRDHTEVKGKMASGKPSFEILVRAEGNIGEVQCKDIDLTKTATIRQFEQKAEDEIKSSIEQALKKARSLKSDILGLGEVMHRADPKAWKGLMKRWHEDVFPEAAVRISAKVNIRRVGTVTNSFLKDLPEPSGDSQ